MLGLLRRKEKEPDIYERRRKFLENETSEQQREAMSRLGDVTDIVGEICEYLEGDPNGRVIIGYYDGFLDFYNFGLIERSGEVVLLRPSVRPPEEIYDSLKEALHERGVEYREEPVDG